MKRESVRFFFFSALAFSVLADPAAAWSGQRADPGFRSGSGSGRIGGKVTDLEGVPLAGLEVRLSFAQNQSLVHKGKTGKKGDFAFANLGTGLWYLTVLGPGYELSSSSVIVSQVEKNAPIRIKLKRSETATPAGLIDDPASVIELSEGRQLFEERKYAGALLRFEAVLAKNPTLASVRVLAADCRLELSDLVKAEEDYQAVLGAPDAGAAAGPGVMARASAGLGHIRIRQGRPEEAGDLFKKAADLAPKDEVLAYNIGEICFAAKSYDEAVAWLLRASEIKPDWPDAHLRLGHAYLAKGDSGEAASRFEKFLSLEPDGERAVTVKTILAGIKK